MSDQSPTSYYYESHIAVVGVTGTGPIPEDEMKVIIRTHGWIVGSKDIWQEDQVIVIGRESFDKNYLKLSLELSRDAPHGLGLDIQCQYVRQEDFSIM